MKPRALYYFFSLLAALVCGNVFAQDRALVSGGESPDKNYRIEVQKPTKSYNPTFVSIRTSKDGKALIVEEETSPYEYEPAKDTTKALWSPDSRLVAISWYVVKRYREMNLARVSGDKAEWITLEDSFSKIFHELKADRSTCRFGDETPSRWLSDTELLIDVLGDCIIGDHAAGQRKEFHYEVCIDVSTGKIKWIKQLEVKAEEG